MSRTVVSETYVAEFSTRRDHSIHRCRQLGTFLIAFGKPNQRGSQRAQARRNVQNVVCQPLKNGGRAEFGAGLDLWIVPNFLDLSEGI